jgi:hypothetical protein
VGDGLLPGAMAVACLLVALVLGLFPVTTSEADGGDRRVECGRAWIQSDSPFESDDGACDRAGIELLRLLSFAALGAAVVFAITTALAVRDSDRRWAQQAAADAAHRNRLPDPPTGPPPSLS